MKTRKNVLIVTDESAETAKLASEIAAVLKDDKVSAKAALSFKGNDILSADVFFLGCEAPKPDSFAYLTDLLKHINLAGRPCGVFSPGSEKAADYLAGLLNDSEAALKAKYFTGSGPDIKNWAQSVLSSSF